MRIELAFKNSRLMKSLTGVTVAEFEALLPFFEQRLLEIGRSKKRQRKIGGGRKGSLMDSASKLFFILFYLKVYPTFDLAGFIFDADRSRPCRWVGQFLPVLETILQRKMVLPKRKITSIEEFKKLFPEIEDLFIDGTERRTQRPKDHKNQKRRYSGKKKTHTRENLIASDKDKRILLVSPTKNGRFHDKKLFDKCNISSWVPPDIGLWVDSGFQGIQKLGMGAEIFIPKKRTKKTPLTEEEKQENQAVASIRIVSEHAIGGIKRFGAATNIFRNKKGQDDKFMAVTAGLWNLHLQMT